MRITLILLSLAILGGCSMRDTVSMDAPTHQIHDLNDVDRDGVIMARERCTDTVLGANVDNYGCGAIRPIDERQELKILFANDSFFIEEAYYGEVEKIADFMGKYPDTQVVIEGHCSKVYTYEHNLVLSQNRANAVADLLTNKFGIAASRVSAIGYSFDRPIDPSDTPEAHRVNRRVIAALSGSDTMANMKWHIYTVDETVK
jgi:OmpA-OmpF porin, OOP family